MQELERKTLADLLRDAFEDYKINMAPEEEYSTRLNVLDRGRVLPLQSINGVQPALILLQHGHNGDNIQLFLAAEAPKEGAIKQSPKVVLSVFTTFRGEDGIFILPTIGDDNHTAGNFLNYTSTEINKVSLALQRKINRMVEGGKYGGKSIQQYKRTFSKEIESALKTPLKKLGLSTAALNALGSIWVRSPRELVEYSKKDLSRFSRFSKTTIAEIEESLIPLGVGLADD
jgi:hypothetical protein